MSNKELLIGKWQPIKECDFINGCWRLYHCYEEGKAFYLFDEEHLTTHSAGYYKDGEVQHYYYNEEQNAIILPTEQLRILELNETHLIFQLHIEYFMDDYDDFRIVLRRYPEDKE